MKYTEFKTKTKDELSDLLNDLNRGLEAIERL